MTSTTDRSAAARKAWITIRANRAAGISGRARRAARTLARCYECGCSVRDALVHLTTLRHRRSTRQVVGAIRTARPSWTIALREDYAGDDDENAAAAARLGIDWA